MSRMQKQQACFENIKSLCANYKKDSASRKTQEYLNKRITSLDLLWADFENQHSSLLVEIENKDINYFTEDVYSKTKAMYESTKRNIMDLLKQLTEEQDSVRFDMADPLDEEVDTNVKLLLSKQERNFKAIDRAMSKICISTTNEKWELEDNLSILKSKWECIEKLHWELDSLLRGSQENYYSMFIDIENKYDEMRKQLNSKIWSMAHYQKSAPRIEIPEFSGNYNHWVSFKDLFIEAVHNNPTINKAQKMQHLKTKLKGEAERLVQHLPISANNYDSCWDILSQRYDNRRQQFLSYMRTMVHLPTIQQVDAYNLKKMHDVINECFSGLSNIGMDVSTWGPMIVFLMSQKLDNTTYNDYVKDLQEPREVPALSDFLFFLESKFLAYETMRRPRKDFDVQQKTAFCKSSNKENLPKKLNYNYNKSPVKTYHATYGQCPFCDGSHVLMQCPKFIALDVWQRNNTVNKLQLCKNCLYSHGDKECISNKTCKECNMNHHSLLHNSDKKTTTKYEPNKPNKPSTSSQSNHHLSTKDMEVLLTTVQLKLQTRNGTFITLRALLDQGSQVNLITENAAQLLRLPRKKMNATISGIGELSGNCKGRIQLTCQSLHSNFTFKTEALILNKLTNNLPSASFEKTNWPHLENLKLADADYNVSRPIDILLGADVYADIIMDGVLKGEQQSPIAQQTHLGWILCGKLPTFNCHVTLVDMSEITKFWENEDIIQDTQDIPKDDQCEEYYVKTVKRASDGRYIVKMPLSPNYEQKLGQSRSIADSQFLQLEKRLEKNNKLADMYRSFIKEYADLHHMKPVARASSRHPHFYLPHHGVLREHAATTKLRVVFNASQKTTTGYSLNQLQEKGPNLQKDIQTLILKWRTYRYAYTADIEKMYRCIGLAEKQQNLQRIIWRDSPNERLREFKLCTVTYGMKCAPWLAMRTLKQLAIDDSSMYPEAADVLQKDMYVDDLISGHNSIHEAKQLQASLINLLRGGGMNLRKWSANHPALLADLSVDQISNKNSFNFKHEESMKTLGLGWNPSTDTFTFNWNFEYKNKQLTKRNLLSHISKLYDPLGWLSPVTVAAKLLFQKVWTSKVGWDEALSSDIQEEWFKLRSDLPEVNNIKLKRWLGGTQQNIQLLGFCDSSEKAYACVVYSRIINEHGVPTITLLAAKTRVAPLAQKTTLPRLELCGALLLSQLVEKIKEAYASHEITTQAWCDSQVVLAWLQGDVSRWDKYVANRVTKIKRSIAPENWAYVKSDQNPADCASRGLYPTKLRNFNLWWNGPDFLQTLEKQEVQKIPVCLFTTNVGIKPQPVTTLATNHNEHIIMELLHKSSSLHRVTRVVAWALRFGTNARVGKKLDATYLTTSELTTAKNIIIKRVQQTELQAEYNQLMKNEPVSQKSSIYKLNPFLDKAGIIRVGGRLNNSNLSHSMKNPVILSKKGRFTQLLIDQAHSTMLHGGARLTLAYIRQRYWIVGGNRAVKARLRHCIQCHRHKPTANYQLMGDLPYQRTTPSERETKTEPMVNKPDPPTSDKQRISKGKITGKKCFSTLFTTFITMFILITSARATNNSKAERVHITSFEPERPIYYDTLGKMRFVHDEWNLIMYYNLSNYWDNVQRVENYLLSLTKLCTNTDERYCKPTLVQLSHEMDMIRHYNSILLAPNKHLSERKKRGLVNGIGYVANELFGILDQNFAEKYQRDIAAVQVNENYLLELMKNQTSIVELENKVLKKTEDNINRQVQMIDKFMNETNENFVSVKSAIEIMMATSYFNSASLATFLLLRNLKSMQEMLFNTLTDVYKGHVDVHLLTPVELTEQLNTISGKLPKSITLPIENVREDIKDIYKLLYMKARVTTDYFLFEVRIPLTSDNEFLLYRAYPLPVRKNTSLTTVQIRAQYIAVNFQQNTYISLTEEDVKQCMELKSGLYMYSKNMPVFNLNHVNAPCEAKLLSHHTSTPCVTVETVCVDSWVALKQLNSWLAVCCGTCTLRTICDSEVTSYTITSTSIVNLAQGCILQFQDFTIYSHNKYNSKIKINYQLDIPVLNSTVNNIVKLSYLNEPWAILRHKSEEDTAEIDRRVLLQREHEVLPESISSHDLHQYIVCYMLIGIAVIALVSWLLRKRFAFCNEKKKQTEELQHEDIELTSQHPKEATQRASKQPRQAPPATTSAAMDNVAFNFD